MRLAIGFLLALLVALPVAGCTSTAEEIATPDSTWVPVTAPAGFPSDFPLAEGVLVRAEELGEEGWSAIVLVESQDDLDGAVTRLTDAGFTVYGSSEADPDARSYSLTNGVLNVSLTLLRAGGDLTAQYSFAPRAASEG